MTLSDVEIIEEMESWDGFAGALRAEDRTLFTEMLRLCYQYFPAMQAKESPFPSEALFMSLLLVQHKTIVWLLGEFEKLKDKKDEGLAV
ncbi:MAG: hypothetical protein HY296_07810 [Thaumarchaeota archaeon]|nr:hypothetical protein [Nitrososphaerota archaeon]